MNKRMLTNDPQGKTLTFYIIAHTLTSGIMGGDLKICIEFVRRWIRAGNKITIITSEDGISVCQKYGIHASYLAVPSVKFRKLGRPLLYLIQAVLTIIISGTIEEESSHVVYSASNFWCDVLPAFWIKKRKKCTWIGTSFLPIPHLFKGFDSAYEKGTLSWPNPKIAALFIFQRLSDMILSKHSDAVLVTNDLDKSSFIRLGVKPERLMAIYGGVDHEAISAIPEQKKEFDGVFVGRLHPQKGLLYLVDIWDRVCKRRNGARLALIGSGDRDYFLRILHEIRNRRLENHVKVFGFMDGDDKYRILKSSRVFLHTPVYDNSGMAAAEAMACGLPAVRFDLPPLRVAYPKGMLIAPLKNCQAFADAILNLLSNPALYNRIANEAIETTKSWNWNIRAEKTFELIKTTVEESR